MRAISGAVATIADVGPSLARRRRENAPKLFWRRLTAGAASRTAGPARWRGFRVLRRQSFPPEISWWGASPSQEQQALALDHVRRSRPMSERMGCAVRACRPGRAPKSTPVSWYRKPRAS
jgi:hypothetical protein